MLEEELKKAVREIDPSLEYVLTYPKSSLYVCKVTRGNHPYILKIFDERAMPDCRDSLSWGREHFENESLALERLTGVDGIPRLIKVYETTRFRALVREYIDGVECSKLDWRKEDVKAKLICTYIAMLQRGIIFLDPRPENILLREKLNPDATDSDDANQEKVDPYIIDLGYVLFMLGRSSDYRRARFKEALDKLDLFFKEFVN